MDRVLWKVGVLDPGDLCDATPATIPVGTDGCTCGQRLDASCPADGAYRNHGHYVSCVAAVANQCVADDLISEEEKGEIVSSAARSRIGK